MTGPWKYRPSLTFTRLPSSQSSLSTGAAALASTLISSRTSLRFGGVNAPSTCALSSVAKPGLIGLEGDGVRGHADDVAFGNQFARTQQALYDEKASFGGCPCSTLRGPCRRRGVPRAMPCLSGSFMEGFSHGKATLGEFGGSVGSDVALFLTVEAEDFPFPGKRLQYFVEPLESRLVS